MNNETIKILANYISFEKIIDDIKSNKINYSVIRDLNKYPTGDFIRKAAINAFTRDPSTIEQVKTLLKSDKIDLVRFSVSVLSRFLQPHEMKIILDECWNRLSIVKEKIFLVYYYANFQQNTLTIEKEKELYDFISNNFDIFINHSLEHLNINDIDQQSDILFNYLCNRFNKPEAVPLTKAWIYLLLASTYPQKEKLAQITSYFKTKQHPILEQVLNEHFNRP